MPSSSSELRRFIFRSQVLALYRSFLREIRDVPATSRGEVSAEIRRQFQEFRGATDLHTIKHLLSDGRQQLKQLRDMLGLRR